MIGTIAGVTAAVMLTACFPQSRAGFLIGLALWGALCAFGASVLRNFASYAAALAGYTAAIITGDELGLVGGVNGDAFQFAVSRGVEISIGIVCASLVFAMTDFGGARTRLASMLIGLTDDVSVGLLGALSLSGSAQTQSRSSRRGMIQRVAGLDPVIDQAAGEIAALPFRPEAARAAANDLIRGSRELALDCQPSGPRPRRGAGSGACARLSATSFAVVRNAQRRWNFATRSTKRCAGRCWSPSGGSRRCPPIRHPDDFSPIGPPAESLALRRWP